MDNEKAEQMYGLQRAYWRNTSVIGAGNDNLHLLTSGERQQLRVDLADYDGNTRYAEYDNFKVSPACTQYTLTSLGTYHGTAGENFLS